MSEEKALTPRQKAIKIIQEGGSVVLDRTLYVLIANPDTGAKGINDLPPEEIFAGDDEVAKAEAVDAMRKQIAELERRLKATTEHKKEVAKETEPKVEKKKEDK